MKYNKYKKQYQKDQQTIKTSDNLWRKSSQGNLIDKKEHEFSLKIFAKKLD